MKQIRRNIILWPPFYYFIFFFSSLTSSLVSFLFFHLFYQANAISRTKKMCKNHPISPQLACFFLLTKLLIWPCTTPNSSSSLFNTFFNVGGTSSPQTPLYWGVSPPKPPSTRRVSPPAVHFIFLIESWGASPPIPPVIRGVSPP